MDLNLSKRHILDPLFIFLYKENIKEFSSNLEYLFDKSFSNTNMLKIVKEIV